MKFKGKLSKPIAKIIARGIKYWSENPINTQQKVFDELIGKAKDTAFGKDHYLGSIKSYSDFKKLVPLTDYEGLKPYIERVKDGEENVLWPGKPIYFAKTSGTTSGTKYIPITHDSISNHMDTARNALMTYVSETGNSGFFDGRMIFLSGSPVLDEVNGIKTGRLSGIVNHHVPAVLLKNQLPSYMVNCIEDWETKVDAIVEETMHEDMRLISGIPPWVQMYFDKLVDKTGKNLKEIFPNLSLLVHGGVNFEPYKTRIFETIGRKIDAIETYPASEGFIAFQDSQKDDGLLLVLNKGIFYEFIPVAEVYNENPTRFLLQDVETDVNYAIVLNTNAGLWGYIIGDTVKFVSTNPYKIAVTGRTRQFISAFGEHVIAEEVEGSLMKVAMKFNVNIKEFTVAPQVIPDDDKLPYHEWFIEFGKEPEDLEKFAAEVDSNLCNKNMYYKDLIEGNILRPLKIRKLRKNAFLDYSRSEGKLGGQFKVVRLSNDRQVANKLLPYIIK